MNAVTRLAEIEWEACLLEPQSDREQERYVRKALGMVPLMVRYFYACPWAVRAMVDFDVSQLRLIHTDPELARLIGLVVSQDNSCRYCYAASRAVLKIMGFTEARIRQLEQDLLTAEVTASVKMALDFTRRISRANPLLSPSEKQPLFDAGCSEGAVKELAFLAAINVFYNRLATLPAVPTESIERLERSWMVAALGPLLAWMMRRQRNRKPAGSAVAYPQAGAYAYLVAGLGDLPIAESLARCLQDAWESPFLSRRAKALVFAVVARGLGCPVSEEEAVRLLVTEGLDPGDIRAILANLASPLLDPVEAAIVPFARETIWYRPALVQRRARALRDQVSQEQFIELIGISALANAVCRMNIVLAGN
jgi:AhpD family alkylhydroperoxidase